MPAPASPETIARARELRWEGLSLQTIARQLGVSYSGVQAWCADPFGGVASRSLTPAERARTHCSTCPEELVAPSPSGLCGFCIEEREQAARPTFHHPPEENR